MDQLFLRIAELSVSATGLILIIIILRPFFQKVPKWITCMLWGLAALRLILPFHVETAMGLIPQPGIMLEMMMETIDEAVNDDSERILYEAKPAAAYEQTDIPDLSASTSMSQKTETDANVNLAPLIGGSNTSTSLPVSNFDPGTGSFSRQIHTLSLVWMTGVILILFYLTVSYTRLRSRLKTATLLRRNVRYTAGIKQSEYVNSPFILGLVKPYIYIPYHLEEETLTYVLAHEETHLRHRDHWLKMIAYLLLCVYWFHPLVWLAYGLFCRDLEFACDERVIHNLAENERRAYARALLHCEGRKLYFSACPIGFGETGVKERIKRVKKYQKPSLWIILLCVGLCAFIAVCFLTNSSRSAVSSDGSQGEMTERQNAADRNITNPGNERYADTADADAGSQGESSSADTGIPAGEVSTAFDTGGQNESYPASTAEPGTESMTISGITEEDIAYIEVRNGNNGQQMRFAKSDSGSVFNDLLNLYRQLDTSENAEQNDRIGYRYWMSLYDQNDTLLQSVIPYKDGFVADDTFYACDMTENPASVNLMNYIDLLFYPGVSAVEIAREKMLLEILEELKSLTYSDETCDGIPEISLQGDGAEYQVNLSEKWAWRDDREADLPEALVEKIRTMLIMK